MRWLIGVLVGLAFAPSAFAGDIDVLRGTQTPTAHWGGIYGGVQGGYTSSTINFGNAPGGQVSFLLRDTAIEQDEGISEWTVLSARSPNVPSYGGFVGYNVEWENLITGFEVNYNHLSLSATSGDALGRSFTDSTNLPTGHHYFYNVNVGAQSSLRMTDIATFRARGGWEVGNFLPYGFMGLAVGRASTSTGVDLSYSAIDNPDSELPPLTPLNPIPLTSLSSQSSQSGAFLYGFASGLGMDVAVTPNVFVRGEFEFIYFAQVNGIQVSMKSGRVGVGLKF